MKKNRFHNLYKRGRMWWFRFKPRGRKEFNITLGTTKDSIALQKRNELLSKLEIHQSESAIGKAVYARLIESDAELENSMREHFPGIYGQVNPGLRISAVMDKYIEAKNSERNPITIETIHNYKRVILNLIEHCGDRYMKDLTSDDLRRYFQEMRSPEEPDDDEGADDGATVKKKTSDRTILNRYTDLNTFYRWAERYDHVPGNLMKKVDVPKFDYNHTKPPPYDLADRLCDLPYPEGSDISRETWEVMPYCFRYTGCRLNEIAGARAEWIVEVDGILCLKVKAGKAMLRKKNLFPDGFKTIPLHPRLIPFLLRVKEKVISGLLFPDCGTVKVRYKNRESVKYGRVFGLHYRKLARELVWPEMKIHSWRSYVIGYLTKVAQIPEIISMDIVGHAPGTVHRDYSGLSPIRVMFEAIKKLP